MKVDQYCVILQIFHQQNLGTNISRKHFSCIYNFMKLYFFPMACRLPWPNRRLTFTIRGNADPRPLHDIKSLYILKVTCSPFSLPLTWGDKNIQITAKLKTRELTLFLVFCSRNTQGEREFRNIACTGKTNKFVDMRLPSRFALE